MKDVLGISSAHLLLRKKSKTNSDAYLVVWCCSKNINSASLKGGHFILKKVMKVVAWGYLEYRLIPGNWRTSEDSYSDDSVFRHKSDLQHQPFYKQHRNNSAVKSEEDLNEKPFRGA